MIIIGDRNTVVVGDIADEIVRLEGLLGALRRLAAGEMPSAEELAAAPLIDHWLECTRPAPCLAGEVHGHPDCRGPVSVTSDVVVFAPTAGWARTISRLYRLGRRHGEEARQ